MYTKNLRWIALSTLCFLTFALSVPVPLMGQSETAAWGTVPSPNRNDKSNSLQGVSAISSQDIWAVGDYNPGNPVTGRKTLIEHWDGNTWSLVSSPNPSWPGIDLATLASVDAVTATDVWAVGYSEDFSSLRLNTLTMHWDGSQWTIVPSPNPAGVRLPNQLFSITAVAANDIWAVGSYGSNSKPLTLHWDGAAWSVVPNNCGSYGGLHGVSAITASDIWAVGEGFSCHYDGSAWTMVPIPQSRPDYFDTLFAVSADASNDVWGVGESIYCSPDGGCSSIAYSIHWTGTRWRLTSAPGSALNGVFARTPGDVWAVGTTNLGTVITHWNGNRWNSIPSPDEGSGGSLNAIDASSPNELWAVGFYADQDFNSRTLAVQSPSTTQGAIVGNVGYSGAVITWIGPENGSTTADSFGHYDAPGLQAGSYTLIVSAQGCNPNTRNVTVVAGQSQVQNIHLQCN